MRFLIFFLLSFILTNCLISQSVINGENVFIEKESDPYILSGTYQNISVKVKKPFVFQFEATPPSGFHWEVKKPNSASLLKLKSEPMFKKIKKSIGVLKEVNKPFTFNPVREGEETVTFLYKKNSDKETLYEYYVNVKITI